MKKSPGHPSSDPIGSAQRETAPTLTMTYHLEMTRKPTYLHVIVTGQNTKENILKYLEEIRRECLSCKCTRVLVEERLDGPRFSTMDVFETADKGSMGAVGVFDAFAYVDVHAVGNSIHFAETVARNRGVPMRAFPTVTAAEGWLLEDVRADDAPKGS